MGGRPKRDAQYWRAKARTTRAIAKTIQLSDTRLRLRTIAADYDDRAREAAKEAMPAKAKPRKRSPK